MLLSRFIRESAAALEALYHPEEARSLVLRLCSHVLGTQSYTHIVEPEYAVPDEALPGLQDAVSRMAAGEPLQYVTGVQEFCGRQFRVTPDVLIPRPETEQLVAEAEKRLPQNAAVLDLCTGSGCIAWTLALDLPGTRVTAVDISPAALSVARTQFEAGVPSGSSLRSSLPLRSACGPLPFTRPRAATDPEDTPATNCYEPCSGDSVAGGSVPLEDVSTPGHGPEGKMPPGGLQGEEGSGMPEGPAGDQFSRSEDAGNGGRGRSERSERSSSRGTLPPAEEAPVFVLGDVLSVPEEMEGAPFDVITANPPYVRESERARMHRNVLEHEPGLALFVTDEDPLVFYRAVAQWAVRFLKPGGWGIVEINEALGDETAEVFQAAGLENVKKLADFYGRDRFVTFEKAA